MHQLHKRLTGAANSSIEIIIAWSELLQMRKRLFVRNWIRRLLRYLCIPVGFFLIVVPLYSLNCSAKRSILCLPAVMITVFWEIIRH